MMANSYNYYMKRHRVTIREEKGGGVQIEP